MTLVAVSTRALWIVKCTLGSWNSTFLFCVSWLIFNSYTVLHPEQNDLLAVFLLAGACLSLRVSGASGTGYNRHQLELKKYTPEAERQASGRKVRRHWSERGRYEFGFMVSRGRNGEPEWSITNRNLISDDNNIWYQDQDLPVCREQISQLSPHHHPHQF